jgi:hypothetical protein
MSTVTETQVVHHEPKAEPTEAWKPKEPLKLSGALDAYKSFDVTPVIGKEFVDVNLKDLLRAPNSDDLIRDLAITSMILNSQCK